MSLTWSRLKPNRVLTVYARLGLRARHGTRARPWSRVDPGCNRGSWRRTRCRCAAASRCLDRNHRGRTCFKEPHRGTDGLGRLIGVEPEVIQRAKANRVGGLILCECFAVPSNGIAARLVIIAPWRAAVSVSAWDVIVCPARFLRRCVKADVTDINSGTQRHAKGLDAAIEVHVI